MRMNRFRLSVALVGAALTISLAACSSGSEPSSTSSGSSSGGPKSLQTVSVGLTGLNGTHMWEFVADDQKLMEPYGVNLKLVFFQGVSQILPAVLGGSVDIGIASTQQAMAAHLQEPGLKTIFGPLLGSPSSVVARKGINTIADLKGKTISVNAAGASNDYFGAKAFLVAHSIQESDVHFVTGGATSSRVAAFLSGAVDAVIVSPPDIARLTAAGGKVLGGPNDLPSVKNALSYSGVAETKWYTANHDVAVKFLQGYQATQKFIHNPANRAKVVAIIAKELKTDTEQGGAIYEYFVTQANKDLDLTGAIHLDNLQATLKQAKDNNIKTISSIDPSTLPQFFDNSLVEEAAKSGH